MLQTLSPDRCVMGRHILLRSVQRCYCITIWVIVCCFKHLLPEVLGWEQGIFTCKSSFPFSYLENQHSEIKTDGLIQDTCIDIKAGTAVWFPMSEQLFPLLELLISSPQTEESYSLICFWWPDKRHFWISLNTLKENVLLMSCQIHVLKSCHKFMKNQETKRMLFKRKILLVKQAGGFIIL